MLTILWFVVLYVVADVMIRDIIYLRRVVAHTKTTAVRYEHNPVVQEYWERRFST